mgnify:CR=1 FL=1
MCEMLSILDVSLLSGFLGQSPELNEGCNELSLIPLGADKGQTNNKVVVNTTSNNNSFFYFIQVEGYCHSLHQIELLVLNEEVKGLLQLLRRNEL